MTNKPEGGRGDRILTPRPQTEVDDEVAFHLERRTQDNIQRGMTPEAARTAALERFGNVDTVRETCTGLLTEDRRAAARRDWFDELRMDLRFAVRSSLRAPMFSNWQSQRLRWALARTPPCSEW